jgi:hypothetical protein
MDTAQLPGGDGELRLMQWGAEFSKARPIDFGIGYRWRPNESNLLLTVKAAMITSDSSFTSWFFHRTRISVTVGVTDCNRYPACSFEHDARPIANAIRALRLGNCMAHLLG